MVCHGGFSLDDKIRRTWYDPEAILNSIGLTAGMTFMDIGCGQGFFTFLAAHIVGGKGLVYAVDVDIGAIEQMKANAAEQGLTNIRLKAGPAEATVFCTACADIVFYSMVLHDFDDPLKVLINAKKMLKPTGRIADLDWKKQPISFGPPERIRFSEEKASDIMRQAGFTIESSKEVGPYHYLVTAKP